MTHHHGSTSTEAALAPLSQRRQGLLRALLVVLAIGGGSVAVPFIVGGVQAIIKDRDNGPTLVLLGTLILCASIVVPIVVLRRWGAALTAVHDPAVTLPFGAKARGDGVTIRARAAVRVVPGILVAMMLLVVLGMSSDGVNPIAVWCVSALTFAVLVLWLWLRRYEVCMDSTGIWSRRRPKWRLAWQDLTRAETLATPKAANQVRPDDLVLHGLVARPGGKVTQSIRLRMNLFAISVSDLERLADHFAQQARGTSISPFDRWS